MPEPPHTFWNDVRGFFISARRDHAVRLRLALAVGLVLGAGLFLVLKQFPNVIRSISCLGSDRKLTMDILSVEDNRPRRNVDGVRTEAGAEDPRLFGVMVENMIDARPISGLAGASLVFEAPVEAGITRMLAIYSATAEVGEIGPVRSARPYYLDWASEFDALYAHVGGSPESLARLRIMDLDDLNEFFNGRYFWRSSRRSAPHNTYTSTEVLREALDNLGIAGAPQFERWIYKEDARMTERPASQEIVVPFSTEAYEVTWRYDRETNSYARLQSGAPHRDKDGTPIVAKNVAVVFTDIEVIDDVGRRRIRTVGSGRAEVFVDGVPREAEWRKESGGERLRFFLPDGLEVEWNAGPTWIEVVSQATKVVYN